MEYQVTISLMIKLLRLKFFPEAICAQENDSLHALSALRALETSFDHLLTCHLKICYVNAERPFNCETGNCSRF